MYVYHTSFCHWWYLLRCIYAILGGKIVKMSALCQLSSITMSGNAFWNKQSEPISLVKHFSSRPIAECLSCVFGIYGQFWLNVMKMGEYPTNIWLIKQWFIIYNRVLPLRQSDFIRGAGCDTPVNNSCPFWNALWSALACPALSLSWYPHPAVLWRHQQYCDVMSSIVMSPAVMKSIFKQ